jgi:cellulose synthase/poly-beta-1,6-N-acetylglucosamine synthase-like glycosyltransferase
MLLFEFTYLISATLLAAYGLNSLLHTWLFWRAGKRPSVPAIDPASSSSADFPQVTVQLPVYNERYVANRLIAAVMKLSWPAERLQVQILDDSIDETTGTITAALQHFGSSDIQVEHICRRERKDYKAGALQAGLASATGKFVVIFDADFVPPADFLLRTIPLFETAEGQTPVGCVQARWGHMNAETSVLTRAQSLGIDGHFVIEQAARDRVGAMVGSSETSETPETAGMVICGRSPGEKLGAGRAVAAGATW